MKYRERRTLTAESLRNTCIKFDWYTNGTNEEYYNCFRLLRDEHGYAEMTTEKLAEVAADIFAHSEEVNALDIPYVMYGLAKACDTVFIEI